MVHCRYALPELDVEASIAGARIKPGLRYDAMDIKELFGVLVQHKLVLVLQS